MTQRREKWRNEATVKLRKILLARRTKFASAREEKKEREHRESIGAGGWYPFGSRSLGIPKLGRGRFSSRK